MARMSMEWINHQIIKLTALTKMMNTLSSQTYRLKTKTSLKNIMAKNKTIYSKMKEITILRIQPFSKIN
jgi:hypothetical protein